MRRVRVQSDVAGVHCFVRRSRLEVSTRNDPSIVLLLCKHNLIVRAGHNGVKPQHRWGLTLAIYRNRVIVRNETGGHGSCMELACAFLFELVQLPVHEAQCSVYAVAELFPEHVACDGCDTGRDQDNLRLTHTDSKMIP